MARKKTSKSSPFLVGCIRLAVRLSSLVPLPLARAVGGGLGWLAWALPTSFRKTTRTNLDLCLGELSDGQRRDLGRRSGIETGKTASESGALMCWRPERLARLVRETADAELLARALAGGRGGMLVIPHLGNWEIFAAWLRELHPEYRSMALYRPPRLAELDRFLLESRERTGIEMVPANPSGLRAALRGLRAGRLMLVFPDQEPAKDNGVFAPFFGTPALTMTLVGSLVRRTGAAVVCGWAERVRGGFRIRFRKASDYAAPADELAAATALNRDVEACVRECPEQYVWSYKRFKTRPPGGTYLYARRRRANGS